MLAAVDRLISRSGGKEQQLFFDPRNPRIQLVLGTFVWDAIDKAHTTIDAQTFITTSADNQPFADLLLSAQHFHGMDVIVRTSPPIAPPPSGQMWGPFDGKLALIRNIYDDWVASEVLLAGKTQVKLLPAANLLSEYQAALEVALGTPVPLELLWHDIWHACPPMVTGLWIHMLPFIPVA